MGRRKDSVRADYIREIVRMADSGQSSRDIVAYLTNVRHAPTARGGRWHSSTVAAIVRRERAKTTACDHAINNENCDHYS